MNAKTLALDQYSRDRRRLNTRLGILTVALIPLPAILLRARFEPLEMLAVVLGIALGVGIVYPAWWRSKHHPRREDGREKRARRIAVVCRTVAFASLVGVMVSWVVGSNVSSWIALAFFATGTSAFIVSFEVEERWKRALQRQNALTAPDSYLEQGRHRRTPAPPRDTP